MLVYTFNRELWRKHMSEYCYDEAVRDAETTHAKITNDWPLGDTWQDKPSSFVVKDSGRRETFDSGMVRDTTEGKVDYSLVLDGPMFDRLAIHLTKGAKKYDARNWMRANGEAELNRFRQSALRHFLQWFRGESDEDHAAGVFFNINGAEYVKERMGAKS